MQYELDKLTDITFERRLTHIKNYLKYIFQGEHPEKYLKSLFPETYQIYLYIRQYELVQNDDTIANFQNYITNNTHNLAKELRSIRLEIIDWLDTKNC